MLGHNLSKRSSYIVEQYNSSLLVQIFWGGGIGKVTNSPCGFYLKFLAVSFVSPNQSFPL